MKSQSFPNFSKAAAHNQPAVFDAEGFLHHFYTLSDPKHIQENHKSISEQLLSFTKWQSYSMFAPELIHFLCRFIKTYPTPQLIALLKITINADKKFEAKNQEIDDVLYNKENIKSLVPSDEAIALPYGPSLPYGPAPAPSVIVLYNSEMNDLNDQKKHGESQGYYKQDHEKLAEYLTQNFRVTKRETITLFFTNAAEVICQELLQVTFSNSPETLSTVSAAVIIELLQLLEYISQPLYTFYLLKLTEVIFQTLLHIFEQKESQKKFSKNQIESILATFNNITERWADTQNDQRELMQWEMQKKVMKLYIRSEVSQKKLHAVKILSQICRRSSYQSLKISEEHIKEFIFQNNILEEIYRADNHPQIITKGQEVFQYITKNGGLSQSLINLIFGLLEKGHEQVSKSLFSTLQSIGEQNFTKYKRDLLIKISQLPRASCFNNEAFSLIETIVVLTTDEEIIETLAILCEIINKNYEKLKENLKNRIVTIYFELFIMGIENDIFYHQNSINILKPFLTNSKSNVFLYMTQRFIFKLKDQASRKTGLKCKKILNHTIKLLITQQKVHEILSQNSQIPIQLLKLLLENYDDSNLLLMSHQDLWILIKSDRQFTKYVHHYPEEVQLQMIQSLLHMENKSPLDLECVIELYQIIKENVKRKLVPGLIAEFFKLQSGFSKQILAPFVLKLSNYSFEQMITQIDNKNSQDNQSLSWLILLEELIMKQDEKGYAENPPFSFLNNAYDVNIKILNLMDISSNYSQFSIVVKNYTNMFTIIKKALQILHVSFTKVKVRLNNKLLCLGQLKEKICDITDLKNVSLQVSETLECEWYNKDELFDKDNALKDQIVTILKEIFHKYAANNGKLRAEHIARIFQKATNTPLIAENDHRVNYLLTNYSNNGDFLTKDQWINYFYQSSLTNAPLVIDNLKKLGYSEYFKGDENLENILLEENELRKEIAKQRRLYDILFRMYNKNQRLNSPKSKEIDNYLQKLLNLLPVSQVIISEIVSHSSNVFAQDKTNLLYYWYVGTLLEEKAGRGLKTENNEEWCKAFQLSGNYNLSWEIYGELLIKVLKIGADRIHVNSSLQISVLEYFGRVLRQSLLIPSLLDVNSGSLIPLKPSVLFDIPFKNKVELNIWEIVPELGKFCCRIVEAKRDEQIAQNMAAVTVYLMIEQAKAHKLAQKQHLALELIFSELKTIRNLFNSFYFIISDCIKDIKPEYYSVCVSASNDSFKHCKQYFTILNKMLVDQQNDKFYKQICQSLQLQIVDESRDYKQADFIETDEILLGKMKVLNEIKIYNPEIQIKESTVASIKHLLETNPSEELRQILYSISNSICNNEYNLELINQLMLGIHPKRNSVYRGNKKMGIMNLGCICYINSVMQQLEMIEPFRRGIIGTEVHNDDLDFFREFQQLIYQLTYGKRTYLIPQSFCLNYLDSSGQPVNIREQHDADEFLNQLLDRLESRLKDTNENRLISNNFKGQMVNIINCQKCFNKKQRVQNFYILSVEIKNQNNLKDCLNKLVEPQIICDYYCDYCEGKVETIQKYHRFESLPPFLFIHLQRLVFDLETFTKIKLDHPLNFPTQIDLQSYFNDQNAKSAVYVLKGFVVHVGTSEGGHYYSIIKCGNEWIKFDDVRIDSWDWVNGSHDKDHAYLLIYEKKQPLDAKIVQVHQKIGNQFIMNRIKQDTTKLLKEKIFLQPSFTKYFLSSINKIHISQSFSASSFTSEPFLSNFYQIPEEAQKELDLAADAIMIYLKLQSEFKQINVSNSGEEMRDFNDNSHKYNHDYESIVMFMLKILHIRPHIANKVLEQFLKDGEDNLFKIIINHRDRVVRFSYQLIIQKSLAIISAQISTSFLLPVPHNEQINKILLRIMNTLSDIGKNPNKMNQYFSIVRGLCNNANFCEWFQRNKLGPKLIHMIMQKDSNLQGLLPEYPFYLNSYRKVESISLMIDIIASLIPFEPSLIIDSDHIKLERKAYQNIQFYKKILGDRYQNEGISKIICYSIKDNEHFTNIVLNNLIENLNRFNSQDKYMYIYIKIFYQVISIEDSLTRMRLERLLGVPILMRINEKERFQYTAQRQTDRICRYWNPVLKPGDEIFLSFLELLYTNKSQLNYLVLLGILALLKLIAVNKSVAKYIDALPGPNKASPRYVKWIEEFLYQANRKRVQSNRDAPLEDRTTILKQISETLREVEISQQKDGIQIEDPERMNASNAINSYYAVGQILFYSEWLNLQFFLAENIFFNNPDEVIQQDFDISSALIDVKYRILYAKQVGFQTEIAKVIEYQIKTKQEAVISFSEGYAYKFILDEGLYELALPFYEDQLQVLKVNITKPIRKVEKKTVAPNKDVSMDTEMEKAAAVAEVEIIPQEFPTISDAYGQQNNHESMKNEENTIECPFCNYIATSFSSRCPGCGQEWGVMM